MCDKKFNHSANTTRAVRISKLFKHLYYHDGRFRCKSPCSKNVYNTRFLHKTENKRNSLEITFDNTVEVFHSTFSIDEQTFLSRLGGSVSSGRTLLWIFLTLLGVFQVQFAGIDEKIQSNFCSTGGAKNGMYKLAWLLVSVRRSEHNIHCDHGIKKSNHVWQKVFFH